MPFPRSLGPSRTFAILLLAPLVGLLVQPVGAGETADVAAVRRLLRQDAPTARAAAVRRLAGRGDAPALEVVVDCLEDPHPYVRRAAAGVIGAVDAEAIPALARRLRKRRSPLARAEACRGAALWADDVGRRLLVDLARDRAADVRAEACRWLAHDPSAVAEDALAAGLADPDGLVRALALDALVGRAARAPDWLVHLRDPDPRVRLSALEGSVARASAAAAGGGTAAVAVRHGLDDAVWSVRLRAAELARTVPDRGLLAPLVRRLGDERARVAAAAHDSLVALTGIPFEADPGRWTRWLEGDGRAFDPAAGVSGPTGRRPPRPGRGHTVEATRFLGLPVPSRHVAFVLDRSGSMARRLEGGPSRWERVVGELAVVLEQLGGARVNVYLFSDEVEAVFPGARTLTAGRCTALCRRLEATRPRGRTALFDGVAAALGDAELDTIVVLSDGAPSAGAFFTKTDLLGELARRNRWRRARIDVISIARDALARRWQGTLERLAQEHGGTYLAR